jgi:hypothetical protein
MSYFDTVLRSKWLGDFSKTWIKTSIASGVQEGINPGVKSVVLIACNEDVYVKNTISEATAEADDLTVATLIPGGWIRHVVICRSNLGWLGVKARESVACEFRWVVVERDA